MKGTERFAETIKAYLDHEAERDPMFAQAYANEGKSLEECVKFILSEVKKSGCYGFCNEEIYSLALHYYFENKVEISDVGGCQVVVNHQVELTEAEVAEAKQRALEQVQREQAERLRRPTAPKKKAAVAAESDSQTSLFAEL